MGEKLLANKQQIRPVQKKGMGQVRGTTTGRIGTISLQERFFF
ncbi:MAG TPA: hypothetical protein PKJ13_06290 [bacterium]|nr:hypothetical protein [bacterium]